MSFLKDIKEKEVKPVVIKRKPRVVKQDIINLERPIEHIIPKINPNIESIVDIPNINIMTSGILLGISLRDNKVKMLEELQTRIEYLLKL